jgi:methyl-accepting chemotaxis protein
MDEVTQQNAALVEEAAAAAESLEDQARVLLRAVEMFRLKPGEGRAALNADTPAAGGGAETPQEAAAGTAALDFDGVIQAHMNWKHKLRGYLAGEGAPLDAEVAARDDGCVLGCWIHGEGRRFGDDPVYSRLRGKHADFHRCAGAVIRAKQSGDEASAKRLLLNDFAVLSDETINEIRALRKLYGHTAAVSVPNKVTRLPLRAMRGARAAAPLPKVRQAAAVQPDGEWDEF